MTHVKKSLSLFSLMVFLCGITIILIQAKPSGQCVLFDISV